MTTEQARELLAQGRRTPHGPVQRNLFDQALALAQEAGDEQLEYEIRYWLTDCACMTGDTDTELTSFVWCLARHDADPERFPLERTDGYAGLLWQFKWMIGALDGSPIFSLAQCEAMLADMEKRYRQAGAGLSGVYISRFNHAWSTGQIEQARYYRGLLNATPRDRYSDCEACTHATLAHFAALTGEKELALKLVDEMTDRGLRCSEEPERVLAHTLLAKLRAGRLNDARNAHMWAYRMSRNNPNLVGAVGDHMQFCAITGNEARGLAMVERHLPWLVHDALNEDGQLGMLQSIGLVLESVVRAGYGEQAVRGAEAPVFERFFGSHEGAWTVADLAPVVWAAAGRLAAAFDTRNGNSYVSGQVGVTRALLDEHYDVPIVTDVFAPPAPVRREPATPQGWLDRAEMLAYADADVEARDAARQVLDGGTAEQRAQAWGIVIRATLRLDGEAPASELLPERDAVKRELGWTAEAESEQRTGLAGYGPGTPDEVAVLEAERERLQSTPGPALASVEICLGAAIGNGAAGLSGEAQTDAVRRAAGLFEAASRHAESRPARHATALRGWAQTQAMLGDLPKALDLAEQALALKPSDGERALILGLEARMMGGLGRFEEGTRLADDAVAIYADYGMLGGVADIGSLAAALCHETGRYTDEVSRLRYALSATEQLEQPTQPLRSRLGPALVNSGHPQEGVEFLWQVLQEQEAAEASPDDRARTCGELAWGFEVSRNYSNAVWMYGQAADRWRAAEQPVSAADLLRRKGNVLRWVEAYDKALEAYDQAWELVADRDEPVLKIAILEGRGLDKAGLGDQTAAQDIDQAIDLARTGEEPLALKIASLTESKGRALVRLKQADQAVPCFLQAADGFSAAGELASAAQAEHFAALTLVDLNRADDAVALWHQGLAHVDQALSNGAAAQDLRSSMLVKLSEALDHAGRTSEAAAVRALMDPAS